MFTTLWHETNFGSRTRKYLEDKINDFQTNSKNIRDMHRGKSEFRRDYDLRDFHRNFNMS